MDETNILHALKDAAMEITDLQARVRALELMFNKEPKVFNEFCNCPNCDGECSERVHDEQ